MRTMRLVAVALASILLLYGTVLVFATFDRYSLSVSDTVRPFVLTMAPVWAVMIFGSWALLRERRAA